MNKLTQIGILFLAAVFEAGGDAILRKALHLPAGLSRILVFLAGAVILFLYGITVNAPAWDFGRLLGIYVVFFFLVAQAISWLVFRGVSLAGDVDWRLADCSGRRGAGFRKGVIRCGGRPGEAG